MTVMKNTMAMICLAGLAVGLIAATASWADPLVGESATLVFSRISTGAAVSSSGIYRTENELQVQGTSAVSQNSQRYGVTSMAGSGSPGPVLSRVRHSYLYQ